MSTASNNEKRSHARKSGLQVRVSVRTPAGHMHKGTVLNVSEGGISLFTEIQIGSELLEIQPLGSALSISVRTKHCTAAPLSVGYVIGCAFEAPPAPEILGTLYVPREASKLHGLAP
jgi:hypothetical protein